MNYTHKSPVIPNARTARHPRLAIPLDEKIEPPRSCFESRCGSGLCRASSGSGTSMCKGVPHIAGEGAREY